MSAREVVREVVVSREFLRELEMEYLRVKILGALQISLDDSQPDAGKPSPIGTSSIKSFLTIKLMEERLRQGAYDHLAERVDAEILDDLRKTGLP